MYPARRFHAAFVLCLCLIPASAPRGAAAATLPYVPLDHWTTPLIVEAVERGLLPGVSLADRPFRRAEIVAALEREGDDANAIGREYSPVEAWLLERLESEFRFDDPATTSAFSRVTEDWAGAYGLEARAFAYAGEDHEHLGVADGRGQIFPYAGFQSGRGLAGGLRFRLDTDGSRAPDFNGRVWRHGATGETRNGYLALQLGAADVILGRDDLRWGASENGTLLLSANAPAMDQVGLRVRLGPITASSFFGNLDDMTLDAPAARAPGDTLPAGTVVRRRITGHRVRWQVNRVLAVGASEVVVYGGKDRAPEPEYMIPVAIYYATQWNSGKNDNILGAFTVDLRPSQRLELYGEFLIDDLQIDDKTPGDEEPFQGGVLLGQRLYDPLGLDGSMLRIEWARIEPYTFNQVLPWNRYLYRDRSIGFPLGSDAQSFDLEFRRWMSEQVTWTLRFRREERGETRATDPWPVPVTGPTASTPFPEFDHVPTGVVERRNRVGGELWIHPNPGVDVRLEGGYLHVANVENVRDDDRSEWWFEGSVALAWSRWFRPAR